MKQKLLVLLTATILVSLACTACTKTETVVICGNCTARLPESSSYCSSCGVLLFQNNIDTSVNSEPSEDDTEPSEDDTEPSEDDTEPSEDGADVSGLKLESIHAEKADYLIRGQAFDDSGLSCENLVKGYRTEEKLVTKPYYYLYHTRSFGHYFADRLPRDQYDPDKKFRLDQ